MRNLKLGAAIYLSFLLAMPAQAQTTSPEQDYKMCLSVYAKKYGRDNQEPVDTILKIAKGECSFMLRAIDKEAASYENFKDLTGSSIGPTKAEMLERAEGSAVRDLLKARTEQKQSGK